MTRLHFRALRAPPASVHYIVSNIVSAFLSSFLPYLETQSTGISTGTGGSGKLL